MHYCDRCHAAVSGEFCPGCGRGALPDVKPEDYCFVTERDEMWAKMFLEILQDQKIPCTAVPTCGAVMAMKAGKTERLKLYVPYAKWEQARELLRETFPEG